MYHWVPLAKLGKLWLPQNLLLSNTLLLIFHSFCTWVSVNILWNSRILWIWYFDLQEQICLWFCILPCLSIAAVSGLFCFMVIFVLDWKVHSNLHLSFSSTGLDWWENHFSVHSMSNFLYRSRITFLPRFHTFFCVSFLLVQRMKWQCG